MVRSHCLLALCSLSLVAACDYSRPERLRAPSSIAVAAGSPQEANSGEDYHDWGHNPWVDTAKDHLSTFAADVDTASYTIARRKLEEGTLPPPASVRVEEWVNYFRYELAPPAIAGSPFEVAIDAAPHPFTPGAYVMRVAVATPEKAPGARAPASLVFLVDVSGSMGQPDKIDLAKKSLHILTSHLTERDAVALVTYAGDSRLVLPMTGMANKQRIDDAIDSLQVGASTAMASGIDLAYEQAMRAVRPGAIARVIVCTDGDANVGAHTHGELLKLIEARARAGVTLSTIGFGMGNYKDTLMEQLADQGNGNNYYIDSERQAARVFGEQLTSTLEVAAKDVKLQLELDPARVARYRLVGYENRDVADRDFRNDRVGGGQVGWGHQVTALYEIEPTAAERAHPGSLGVLHVRAKPPYGDGPAAEQTFAMPAPAAATFEAASRDLRFAFAVAAFADVLRGATSWPLDDIRRVAIGAAGGERDELVRLIDRARSLGVNQVAKTAAIAK